MQFSDVLLTKDGANTGNASLNTIEGEFSLLSSVALLRADNKKSCNEFLLQYILSPKMQYIIKNEMIGQAITRLTLKRIKLLPIILPPLTEQKKIAEILSTWDRAIELTEKLIEAKEKKKRGLMQQLLTGKKRFPGFSGKWEKKKLDEIVEFYKGKGLSKKDISKDGSFKCIHYGELFTKYNENIENILSFTEHRKNMFFSKKMMFSCQPQMLHLQVLLLPVVSTRMI